MSSNKELYDEALEQLKEIVAQAGLYGQAAPLMKDVDPFQGELRRKNALLRGRVEELEGENRAITDRLQGVAALTSQVEELRRRKQELEGQKASAVMLVSRLETDARDLRRKLEASGAAEISEGSTFTMLKVKCLECSLHFIVCTSARERHSAGTLHCPECGQRRGRFIVWQEAGRGHIFQHVPGRAAIREVSRKAKPQAGSNPGLGSSPN